MPAVSVIVPIYKVEQYIRRCIDSVLAQTFTDFELILVDDGSPDKCPAICDEYAKYDDRIVVIHQQNGGLSAARNAGIDWAMENSDSEWIMFVDSDDWINKRTLEIMVSANCCNKTKLCMCLLKSVFGDHEEKEDNNVDDKAVVMSQEDAWCKLETSINAVCKLYAKTLFENIRFPIGKLHEDTFVTYKLVYNVDSVSAVFSCLYYYFNNSESITRTWNARRLDVVDAYEEQIEFFKDNGYETAYKNACLSSISYCATMLYEMDRTLYPRDKKFLKKIVRNRIKEYKKLLNLSPYKYAYLYDAAYPLMMKFWRIGVSVKSKIKLLFKRLYTKM